MGYLSILETESIPDGPCEESNKDARGGSKTDQQMAATEGTSRGTVFLRASQHHPMGAQRPGSRKHGRGGPSESSVLAKCRGSASGSDPRERAALGKT